jgi:arginase
VLDVREGRANEFAAPRGPTLATVLDAVGAVFDRFDVAAVALTAYDPAEDADGRARTAARRILGRVAERSRSR